MKQRDAIESGMPASPWLRWFADGLDSLILAEARRHPFFIAWFRAIVNDACDRVQAQTEEEQG